jgi:hypothetical protein
MTVDDWWESIRDDLWHTPEELARAAWEAAQQQLDPETITTMCGRYMAQFRPKRNDGGVDDSR